MVHSIMPEFIINKFLQVKRNKDSSSHKLKVHRQCFKLALAPLVLCNLVLFLLLV